MLFDLPFSISKRTKATADTTVAITEVAAAAVITTLITVITGAKAATTIII